MRGGALAEIARRRCATPAQIMLAWTIRGGVIAIPKAGGAEHVEENFRSLNVELTEEDLRDIDAAFPARREKFPSPAGRAGALPPKLRLAPGGDAAHGRPQAWAKWRVCNSRNAAALRRR